MKENEELLEDFKVIGEWIASQTQMRRYPKKEIKDLSDRLVRLKKHFEGDE